ncbi:hypothetical protein PF004_g23544 [Phytophthora fragariae]|uniref:Bulb-type lectin domain-containing protein n=1 Tax=Phytophthora fragariae TaxID=53985 RepID=A0A6G0MXQ2_9STRA|nr:hypothetical protein PF004_g23544 [Phytophthora fragariae]
MQSRLVSALAAAALASPRVGATATSYGPFTVTVSTNASSLSIVNSAGDQVWKSASDRAFISASPGLTTITQASGNFQLSSNDVGTPCQAAVISSSLSSSDSVEVTGSFADSTCSGWTWTISFALDASYAGSSDDDSQTPAWLETMSTTST